MPAFEGCPGSRMLDRRVAATEEADEATGPVRSQLRQWPIQLHLVSPTAPYYQGADVLLTADCVGYALGGFHPDWLKGKSLAIACPKLDQGQGTYVDKIVAWFDQAKINTLTVMVMEVPCCMGLVSLVQQAATRATRKVPVKFVQVSLKGEVLKDEWLSV